MTVAATGGRTWPDGRDGDGAVVCVATDARRPLDRRISRLFVHIALIGAIILQRFCLYAGGSPFFVAQLVFLAAIVAMLLSGRAVLRPVVLLLLVTFATIALVGTVIALNDPDARVGISLGSLIVVFLLYAVLVIRPDPRFFDGRSTFAIFVGYMRVCSVLGIVQYLIQFVGIRVFSFTDTVPLLRPFLAEQMYNYRPWLSYGSSLMRSNGFFLLEPSIFSQLLVLALLVDVFVRRVWRYAPLYLVAHMLSYSGTGLLALALTLPLVALVDVRYSRQIAAFAIALVVLGVIGAVALPDQFGALVGRSSELSYSGSSGYARYVAPFQVVGEVWGETRTLIGYGPGALERADFYIPGSSSALIKLFIDYGILGLVAFVTFLVVALWRRDVAILSVYGLVNFQLGGGFLLFPPFIVIMALLCIWSTPEAPAPRSTDPTLDPAPAN